MNTYRIMFSHSGGKRPQYELRANNLEHAIVRARKAYTYDHDMGFTDPVDKLQLFTARVIDVDAAYNEELSALHSELVRRGIPYSCEHTVDDLKALLSTNDAGHEVLPNVVRESDLIEEHVVPPFRTALAELLNKYGRESESNTPDFILANFLTTVLAAFDVAVRERDRYASGYKEPIEDMARDL